MSKIDPLELAQLIVRGHFINISSKKAFMETSSIYRFTNEDITSYFHHLEKKREVLSVIGSGGQILNGILAGTRNFDCFDISVFPEYYLSLQIASIIALSKEDYLKYYFSEDREELFGDDFYDQISLQLHGKYKEFWDTLYDFDDGIDIYNSLLFRHDLCLKKNVLAWNLYLHEGNYEKLKGILKTEKIVINPSVCDVTKTRFEKTYDLVNLSNIWFYHYSEKTLDKFIEYLQSNFNLSDNGEIINYFFDMDQSMKDKAERLLKPNGYVEDLGTKKLLVYKR